MKKESLPFQTETLALASLPFSVILLLVNKGQWTLLGVSPQAKKLLTLQSKSDPQKKIWEAIESLDRAKVTNMVQFANLYSQEGEESQTTIRYKVRTKKTLSLHLVCRSKTIKKDRHLVYVIASENRNNDGKNLTLPPKEEAPKDASLLDITEDALEKQLLSRLTEFGYDIMGVVSLKTKMCRFFRLKKLSLGMEGSATLLYQDAILGNLQNNVVKDEVPEVRKNLALKNIVAHLAEWPVYDVPYSIISHDGKFKRKSLQFSYLDEKKDTLFLLRSDITAPYLKEQEQIERLKAAKLAADQANESKSVFFSSMSHDIRAPLNGILGFTALALKEQASDKKDEDLQSIQSSAQLLLGMVNDTLDLSSIESGKTRFEKVPLFLPEAFETVLSALRSNASIKNVALVVEKKPPEVTVLTDTIKFEKIFLNLLSNAIKYTPAGGVVKIRLSQAPKNGPFILQVKDNGIGIRKEYLPHLYEAFSQDKRPETQHILGTGLGLSIVKRYVDMLGGTIAVESQIHRGTTFTVTLPFEVVKTNQKSSKIQPSYSHLKGQKILLADDNDINIQIEKALLEEEGMTVAVATSGKEAVDLFLHSPVGHFSLLLLDYQMPLLNGAEAAKKIRASGRKDAHLPIVALSGEALAEDQEAFAKAEMSGYLLKPVEPEKLFALLSSLLA
jgi:signal transduction histidine kinase